MDNTSSYSHAEENTSSLKNNLTSVQDPCISTGGVLDDLCSNEDDVNTDNTSSLKDTDRERAQFLDSNNSEVLLDGLKNNDSENSIIEVKSYNYSDDMYKTNKVNNQKDDVEIDSVSQNSEFEIHSEVRTDDVSSEQFDVPSPTSSGDVKLLSEVHTERVETVKPPDITIEKVEVNHVSVSSEIEQTDSGPSLENHDAFTTDNTKFSRDNGLIEHSEVTSEAVLCDSSIPEETSEKVKCNNLTMIDIDSGHSKEQTDVPLDNSCNLANNVQTISEIVEEEVTQHLESSLNISENVECTEEDSISHPTTNSEGIKDISINLEDSTETEDVSVLIKPSQSINEGTDSLNDVASSSETPNIVEPDSLKEKTSNEVTTVAEIKDRTVSDDPQCESTEETCVISEQLINTTTVEEDSLEPKAEGGESSVDDIESKLEGKTFGEIDDILDYSQDSDNGKTEITSLEEDGLLNEDKELNQLEEDRLLNEDSEQSEAVIKNDSGSKESSELQILVNNEMETSNQKTETETAAIEKCVENVTSMLENTGTLRVENDNQDFRPESMDQSTDSLKDEKSGVTEPMEVDDIDENKLLNEDFPDEAMDVDIDESVLNEDVQDSEMESESSNTKVEERKPEVYELEKTDSDMNEPADSVFKQVKETDCEDESQVNIDTQIVEGITDETSNPVVSCAQTETKTTGIPTPNIPIVSQEKIPEHDLVVDSTPVSEPTEERDLLNTTAENNSKDENFTDMHCNSNSRDLVDDDTPQLEDLKHTTDTVCLKENETDVPLQYREKGDSLSSSNFSENNDKDLILSKKEIELSENKESENDSCSTTLSQTSIATKIHNETDVNFDSESSDTITKMLCDTDKNEGEIVTTFTTKTSDNFDSVQLQGTIDLENKEPSDVNKIVLSQVEDNEDGQYDFKVQKIENEHMKNENTVKSDVEILDLKNERLHENVELTNSILDNDLSSTDSTDTENITNSGLHSDLKEDKEIVALYKEDLPENIPLEGNTESMNEEEKLEKVSARHDVEPVEENSAEDTDDFREEQIEEESPKKPVISDIEQAKSEYSPPVKLQDSFDINETSKPDQPAVSVVNHISSVTELDKTDSGEPPGENIETNAEVDVSLSDVLLDTESSSPVESEPKGEAQSDLPLKSEDQRCILEHSDGSQQSDTLLAIATVSSDAVQSKEPQLVVEKNCLEEVNEPLQTETLSERLDTVLKVTESAGSTGDPDDSILSDSSEKTNQSEVPSVDVEASVQREIGFVSMDIQKTNNSTNTTEAVFRESETVNVAQNYTTSPCEELVNVESQSDIDATSNSSYAKVLLVTQDNTEIPKTSDMLSDSEQRDESLKEETECSSTEIALDNATHNEEHQSGKNEESLNEVISSLLESSSECQKTDLIVDTDDVSKETVESVNSFETVEQPNITASKETEVILSESEKSNERVKDVPLENTDSLVKNVKGNETVHDSVQEIDSFSIDNDISTGKEQEILKPILRQDEPESGSVVEELSHDEEKLNDPESALLEANKTEGKSSPVTELIEDQLPQSVADAEEIEKVETSIPSEVVLSETHESLKQDECVAETIADIACSSETEVNLKDTSQSSEITSLPGKELPDDLVNEAEVKEISEEEKVEESLIKVQDTSMEETVTHERDTAEASRVCEDEENQRDTSINDSNDAAVKDSKITDLSPEEELLVNEVDNQTTEKDSSMEIDVKEDISNDNLVQERINLISDTRQEVEIDQDSEVRKDLNTASHDVTSSLDADMNDNRAEVTQTANEESAVNSSGIREVPITNTDKLSCITTDVNMETATSDVICKPVEKLQELLEKGNISSLDLHSDNKEIEKEKVDSSALEDESVAHVSKAKISEQEEIVQSLLNDLICNVVIEKALETTAGGNLQEATPLTETSEVECLVSDILNQLIIDVVEQCESPLFGASILQTTSIEPHDFDNMGSTDTEEDDREEFLYNGAVVGSGVLRLSDLAQRAVESAGVDSMALDNATSSIENEMNSSDHPMEQREPTPPCPIPVRNIKQEKVVDVPMNIKEEMMDYPEDPYDEIIDRKPIIPPPPPIRREKVVRKRKPAEQKTSQPKKQKVTSAKAKLPERGRPSVSTTAKRKLPVQRSPPKVRLPVPTKPKLKQKPKSTQSSVVTNKKVQSPPKPVPKTKKTQETRKVSLSKVVQTQTKPTVSKPSKSVTPKQSTPKPTTKQTVTRSTQSTSSTKSSVKSTTTTPPARKVIPAKKHSSSEKVSLPAQAPKKRAVAVKSNPYTRPVTRGSAPPVIKTKPSVSSGLVTRKRASASPIVQPLEKKSKPEEKKEEKSEVLSEKVKPLVDKKQRKTLPEVAPKRNVAKKSTTPLFGAPFQNKVLLRGRPKKSRNVAKKSTTLLPRVKEPEPQPIYGVFVDTNFGGQNMDMFINENDDSDDGLSPYVRPKCNKRRYASDDNYYGTWSPDPGPSNSNDNSPSRNLAVHIERIPIIDQLLPRKKKSPEKYEPNLCDLCEPKRIFLSKLSLAQHIHDTHTPKEPCHPDDLTITFSENTDTCIGCMRKFHSKNRLIDHVKTCKQLLEMTARHSGVKIPTKSVAISKTTTEKKPEEETGIPVRHACDVCGKKFLMAAGLAAHEKTHKGVAKLTSRPGKSLNLTCSVCQEDFTHYSALIEHMSLHSLTGDEAKDVILQNLNNIGGLKVSVKRKVVQLSNDSESDADDDLTYDSDDYVDLGNTPKESEVEKRDENSGVTKKTKKSTVYELSERLSKIVSKNNISITSNKPLIELDDDSDEPTDFTPVIENEIPKKLEARKEIPSGPEKCEECNRLFTIRSVYEKHISYISRVSSLEDQTKCPVCGIELHPKCKLGVHIESHNPKSNDMEQALTCKQCNKVFRSENNLIRHELEHEGMLRVYCQNCGETFQNMCDLNTHQEECKYKNKEFKCEVCNKVFSAKWRLDLHMKIDEKHGTERVTPTTYYCDQCGKDFKGMSALKKHIDSKCGTEPIFECVDCDKKYFSRGSLAAHKRTHHTSEKNFICQYCSKDFFTRTQLERHELRHTPQVRPYYCKYPNCDKAYRQADSLRAHECEHTGIYPYTCEFCCLQFSNVKSLKLHRKSTNHWSDLEPNKVVTQACRRKSQTGSSDTYSEECNYEKKKDEQDGQDEPKNLVINETQPIYTDNFQQDQRVVTSFQVHASQYTTLQPFSVNHLIQANQQTAVVVQPAHPQPLSTYSQVLENYFVMATHQEQNSASHHLIE